MALERSFSTPLPPPAVWAWIGDLEQLVGAIPGFSQGALDDTGLTGKLVLRVGAQRVTYTGQIAVTTSDLASGRLHLAATGTGARGSGEASAEVQIRLDGGADGTTVTVVVAAAGSGRIETFDRESVRASGERLLDRFVAAIQEQLPATQSEPEPVAEREPAAEPEPVAQPERVAVPEPVAEPERVAVPEPVAEPEPVPEPEPERLATVTSISDVIRDRSRARRSAAASAVAMVAAVIALWLVHRRNAH